MNFINALRRNPFRKASRALTVQLGNDTAQSGQMLSLGDRFVPHIVPCDGFYCEESWSEWQDLNLRPPRPERGGTDILLLLIPRLISLTRGR